MEKMNVAACRKPGDWICRSCQYPNFSKRDACQRCGEAKLGIDRTDYATLGGDWDVKPGDWYCCVCGVHNYASRGCCFKCAAAKNDAAAVAEGWRYTVPGQAGMKPGDWICPRLGCNVQNYANRTECFRCNMPRSTVDRMTHTHRNRKGKK